MKKYILLLMCLPLVCGCYSDEGNYDYREINEIIINTENFQMEYPVNQYDLLSVKPNIDFSQEKVDDDNISYTWTLFSDDFKNTVSEVIGRERNLSYQVKQPSSATSYSLVLDVTNKINNFATQKRFIVRVNSQVTSGWMVLHIQNGEADADYIASKNAVPTVSSDVHMRNVYSSANGTKMEGNPTFIRGARRNNTVINFVYAGTDKDLYKMNGKTFAKECEFKQMFTIVPENVRPQKYEIGTSFQGLINDNQVHTLMNQSAWEITFSYATPGNVTVGEVELASFMYPLDGFSSPALCVLYDNLSQRFVMVPRVYTPVAQLARFDAQPSTPFDVDNMQMDLLHMDIGNKKYSYWVFKDPIDDSRWLCIADFEKSAGEQFAIRKTNMSALTDVKDALFYSAGNRGDFLLYATKNMIYSYDYSGSNTSSPINDPFPEGEEITAVKIYKCGTYNGLAEVDGTILYVATWNGNEGKLYEFSLNETTGSLRNKAAMNVFVGFGKIVDMCNKTQGLGTGS